MFKSDVDSSQIKENRTQLMGIAALCIMLCHNTLIFNISAIQHLNEVYIQRLLQVGVDIFFFLSGLGCSYSIKQHSTKIFYKNRILRIFPTYIFVAFIISLISVLFLNKTIYEMVWSYSLITFFLRGMLGVWFIAGIIVLYLATPLLYKISEQNKLRWLITGIIVISFLTAIISSAQQWNVIKTVNQTFIIRIPAYIIGFYIGIKDISLCFKTKNVFMIIFILLIMYAVLIQKSSIAWWICRLIFCPLSIAICLLISGFRKKSKINVISKLGGVSLELYLIHQFALQVIDRYIFISSNSCLNSLLNNMMAIAISIVLAFTSNIIIKFLSKRIKLC